MARFFLIVLDGVGAGALPDAAEYGDEGSNTLGNLALAAGGLDLPALGSMGLGNIVGIKGVAPVDHPRASWGRMRELSKGKDTITGHWEMAGIVSSTPFPTYPKGFPPEIIAEFTRRTGRGVLCNAPASGTEVIERLGDEHKRTGAVIVYTSADSVFQIAAHESVVPVEELYSICREARQILRPPHNVARVIARPFVGPPYKRTYSRRDFPVDPPSPTVLDAIRASGQEVLSVGKVIDMFNGRGFSGVRRTHGNTEGMGVLTELRETFRRGMVFANLVDFDTLYGHRNDTAGFRAALEDFDRWLGGWLPGLGDDDYMVITADHGLDPTTPGTDHSREYAPLIVYNKKTAPAALGTREGFCDVGATAARALGVSSVAGEPLI